MHRYPLPFIFIHSQPNWCKTNQWQALEYLSLEVKCTVKKEEHQSAKNSKVLDSILKWDLGMLVSRQIASFFLLVFLSCLLSIFISNGLKANSLQILVTDLSTCWLLVTSDFFPLTLFITLWLVFWDNPSKVLYYLSNNSYPAQTSLLPPGKHSLHCHLLVDKWTSVSVRLAHDPLNKKRINLSN